MARRGKGRNISGWLIVDKPAGLTSSDVVNKVKWAFSAAKAGHAGTLDPAATGMLAVALGEATKTVPYVTDALKAYTFNVRFGQATTTDDAEGDVIATSTQRPTDTEIKEALQSFVGDIEQTPPQYSAVKVDGARAYARARGGEHVALAPRPLFVERLLLLERPDPDHAELEMVCGKGGYVRSIARDLGCTLGCHAHVETLRRLWTGSFDIAQSVDIQTIEASAKTPEIDKFLLPLETGLSELPKVQLSESGATRVRNGNPGEVLSGDAEYGAVCWGAREGKAVAIGLYKSGHLHPTRVFRADTKG